MSTPTSVYRYYDSDGRLIYVGITSKGPQRQAQHAVTADWWPHVRSQDVEHLDTREAALKREKWLIEHHRPPFNRQHNPAHEKLREAYLKRRGDSCAAASTCPDDDACYAYVAGINTQWCGDPGCQPCHIRWHGYEDGVEAALNHVGSDVYVVLETLATYGDPAIRRLADEVFAAGRRLLEALECVTDDDSGPIEMNRLAIIRENFIRMPVPEGAPF